MTADTGIGRGRSSQRLRWIRSAAMMAMALLLSALIVEPPAQLLAWVLAGLAFLLMLIIAFSVHRWMTRSQGSGSLKTKRKE